MPRITVRICISLLSFASGAAAFAAPAIHPFEAPPSFERTSPALLAAPAEARAVVPQGCAPQGSLTRSDRSVAVTLHFVRGQFTINNPDPTDPQPGGEDPVELRSYGGCKAGPVIEVKPADTLRINLLNDLPADDPSCLPTPPVGLALPPGVGCFNTTNLHTHGLHVSPAGNSDNVLLAIAPQTRFPYEYHIPGDHPAGTFWYHTHMHGSTAVQVASGSAGLLIIRGDRAYTPPTSATPHPVADIDTILHDQRGTPLAEKLFLFQQIAYACFQNQPGQTGGPWQQIYTSAGLYNVNSTGPSTSAPWTCPLAKPGAPVSRGVVENFALQLDSPTIWDTNGRFTSINGVVQPTITLAAGELQRWRFAHAGIHDTINIQIVRASPGKATNLIAASALSGNREQQKASLAVACQASAATLIPQFEIATDGLTRTKIHEVRAQAQAGGMESNYLQPGYRSDILVAFPTEGDYCLLDQAAPAGERPQNGGGGGQGPSTPQLLAYIHVRGGHAVGGSLADYVETSLADANPTLPAPILAGLRQGDLTPWAPFVESPPPTVPALQTANFTISGPPPGQAFPLFQINGASYDPDKVNYTRQVNTTDDWLLTAQGEPHIFHIHVNPFEVMDVTAADKDGVQRSIFDASGHCRPDAFADQQHLANQYCGMYHVFRDTIFVENGYQVHVRTTYDRFIGEFVLHCHILDHEDAGMMANISIVPNLAASGGGLGMPNMHHETMAMPHP